MRDEEAPDTIASGDWCEIHAESVEIFDDRPTLRSPIPPPPPPSTRRTWSTLLRDAASIFNALSDAVLDLERRRARGRSRAR
ncbi:MAG TPA: hypothetical protein VIF62_13420 [Labilithrix sp.]